MLNISAFGPGLVDFLLLVLLRPGSTNNFRWGSDTLENFFKVKKNEFLTNFVVSFPLTK